MNWIETNNYLNGMISNISELVLPVRIAAFDLDDTLIYRPKSKKSDQKWKIINHNIQHKIKDLVEQRYYIIVFSNQSSMGSNKNFDHPGWRKAICDLHKIIFSQVIENNLEYYFAIYVAKKFDIYRKPNLGLWHLMKDDIISFFDQKIQISKRSFYCGDAAGRVYAGIIKKKLYPSTNKGDFSDTDRKFALNIGINFYTPEDFYLDESPEIKYVLSGLNPKIFIDSVENSDYTFIPRKKEMIIMIGLPGSGKTDFVEKNILPHKYIHINRDKLKRQELCLQTTETNILKGKSIVIDNTNPDVTSRYKYISIAKKYKYKIRAIIMNTDIKIAQHLNNVRHVYSNGTIPKISSIVYNIFNKKYIKPLEEEGFDKIEKIKFCLDLEYFNDPMWKKAFMLLSEFK